MMMPRKFCDDVCNGSGVILQTHKFDFGWGSAPDPMLGELTALPQIH